MKIYNNANLITKHRRGVLAIGNFDGIHLGHQKVINEAKSKAKKSHRYLDLHGKKNTLDRLNKVINKLIGENFD